ncbi:POK25 protein, partial [Semnornis frantzii]|nr:POK25 protein [Semnornis frantzii]
FLTEGSACADLLTASVHLSPVPQTLQQAQLSHTFFHQSAKALKKQFAFSWTVMAKEIMCSCPDCQAFAPIPQLGVNSGALQALQLWQTDGTHVPTFGQLKSVHFSVATFLGTIWATPR